MSNEFNSASFETTKEVLRVVLETENDNTLNLDIEDPKPNLTLASLEGLVTAAIAIMCKDAYTLSPDPVTGLKEAYYLKVEHGEFDEE